MKRTMVFTAFITAIVLSSASAVLAGPIQTWEDIAKARQHMKLEIEQSYRQDTPPAHKAYAAAPDHKSHLSREQTREH